MTHSNFLDAPTLMPEDIDLLRACLCEAEIAAPAFHRWKATSRPEQVHNQAHFRILPLLHDRLAALDVEDPLVPKLRQTRHKSWAKAQARLRHAERALEALAQARVTAMVCKGMALVNGYYADAALRPMADIDILVKPEDVASAIEALRDIGWRGDIPFALGSMSRREYMARGNAVTLSLEGGCDIDLHWQPYHECLSENLRTAFWDSAEEIKIGSARCLSPAPANLLMHVVTHGMRPNVLNPMRWIVDATKILDARGEDIDWAALYRTAHKARILKRFCDGLLTLERVLMSDVAPKPPIMRPSIVEVLEQRAFKNLRKTKSFGKTPASMLWAVRLRILLSDAGRNPDVWRAYLYRKLRKS